MSDLEQCYATSLITLRERTKAKLKSKHDYERAVARDLEKRRVAHRQQEELEMQQHVNVTPQHTDMTFWVTKVWDAPKGVPEQQKGVRAKGIKRDDNYEMNFFRWHALQNFVYWKEDDDISRLSK